MARNIFMQVCVKGRANGQLVGAATDSLKAAIENAENSLKQLAEPVEGLGAYCESIAIVKQVGQRSYHKQLGVVHKGRPFFRGEE